MKFKKGDRVRMREFPEVFGTVTAARKDMLWCKLDKYKGSVPFCKPRKAELVTEKQ